MIDFDEMDEAPGGRLYDIVVYGATGYTGCLVVEHLDSMLSGRRATPHKWAIAGRSMEKLKVLASRCKTEPDVLEASTPEQVADMADLCSVVLAIAGPYSLCGEAVIRACVEKRTHYVDITGEVVWMKKMVARYHDAAREKGVMIIQSAGLMCAPHDVMLNLLCRKLGALKQFRLYCAGIGSQSGGTFFTGYKQYEGMMPHEFQDIHLSPFSLGGMRGKAPRGCDADQGEALQDQDFPGVWTYTGHATHCALRIMRRSCQLLEEEGTDVGKDLVISCQDTTLDEKTAKRMIRGGHGPQDVGELVKFARTMEAMANTAPKPGGGAPAATRQLCYIEDYAVAEGENGEWAHVHFQGPEGYEVSAIMCVAAALTILEEPEAVNMKERGGVLTPAFALRDSSWMERIKVPFGESNGRPVTYEVCDGKPSLEALQHAVFQSDTGGGAFVDGMRKGTVKAWAMPEIFGRTYPWA